MVCSRSAKRPMQVVQSDIERRRCGSIWVAARTSSQPLLAKRDSLKTPVRTSVCSTHPIRGNTGRLVSPRAARSIPKTIFRVRACPFFPQREASRPFPPARGGASPQPLLRQMILTRPERARAEARGQALRLVSSKKEQPRCRPDCCVPIGCSFFRNSLLRRRVAMLAVFPPAVAENDLTESCNLALSCMRGPLKTPLAMPEPDPSSSSSGSSFSSHSISSSGSSGSSLSSHSFGFYRRRQRGDGASL